MYYVIPLRRILMLHYIQRVSSCSGATKLISANTAMEIGVTGIISFLSKSNRWCSSLPNILHRLLLFLVRYSFPSPRISDGLGGRTSLLYHIQQPGQELECINTWASSEPSCSRIYLRNFEPHDVASSQVLPHSPGLCILCLRSG
jgi:hypothetical protein